MRKLTLVVEVFCSVTYKGAARFLLVHHRITSRVNILMEGSGWTGFSEVVSCKVNSARVFWLLAKVVFFFLDGLFRDLLLVTEFFRALWSFFL